MANSNNLSSISLKEKRKEVSGAIYSLKRSMDCLACKDSFYYKSHELLVDTYTKVLAALDCGLRESEILMNDERDRAFEQATGCSMDGLDKLNIRGES